MARSASVLSTRPRGRDLGSSRRTLPGFENAQEGRKKSLHHGQLLVLPVYIHVEVVALRQKVDQEWQATDVIVERVDLREQQPLVFLVVFAE